MAESLLRKGQKPPHVTALTFTTPFSFSCGGRSSQRRFFPATMLAMICPTCRVVHSPLSRAACLHSRVSSPSKAAARIASRYFVMSLGILPNCSRARDPRPVPRPLACSERPGAVNIELVAAPTSGTPTRRISGRSGLNSSSDGVAQRGPSLTAAGG